MNLDNLRQVLADQPKYRYKQVFEAIYKDLITDWSEATNLPKALRERLADECPLAIKYELIRGRHSDKALVTLADGARIETVLMKHANSAKSAGRQTVCVSVQVGCPIGCVFCETGKLGLTRGLTAPEMVEQVLLFARLLKANGQKVTNVVYMGMGEPLLNYAEVLKSIQALHDPEGFNLGARHFSISTSGIVPGIQKLAKEKLEVNLAVSLHAPTDALRTQLMPINRTYQLKELLHAVRQYIQATNRKVMFEYIMIDGLNDSPKEARELASLLAGLLGVVNLIPYNGKSYKASSPAKIEAFLKILKASHINVVERASFGRDIKGACGQLAAKRNG